MLAQNVVYHQRVRFGTRQTHFDAHAVNEGIGIVFGQVKFTGNPRLLLLRASGGSGEKSPAIAQGVHRVRSHMITEKDNLGIFQRSAGVAVKYQNFHGARTPGKSIRLIHCKQKYCEPNHAFHSIAPQTGLGEFDLYPE